MATTLTALQQQRRDTAANWSSQNPTLLAGEIGFESDTKKFKFGDGSTVWNSLAYIEDSYVTKALVNAKGDLIAATANDTVTRLAVGTDNQVLSADSSEATGLKWIQSKGATGGGTDAIFYENLLVVTTSYSITANSGAHSVGPIALNSGVTITIPSTSTWVVS